MTLSSDTIESIEKEALDWFATQPMGSVTRMNGPAAIEGFKAGARLFLNKSLSKDTTVKSKKANAVQS